MDEALGMDPAQGMLAEGELAGIAVDDHRPGQQAMCLDSPLTKSPRLTSGQKAAASRSLV